ncbi:MAG TPA: hypothetical protein VHH13_01510 [Arthrobacter sp.]|jgi:membrane protein implicated in regulation of membrane protease activity|nr:hypothetical protein [Arthrobacter sp.]
MKQLLTVLLIAAIILLVLGIAVQAVKFLLYVGLAVLVVSGAVLLLTREQD